MSTADAPEGTLACVALLDERIGGAVDEGNPGRVAKTVKELGGAFLD